MPRLYKQGIVPAMQKKITIALPHKTVVTCAGIGWSGKCALLVADHYGLMVWFSFVLTNEHLIIADSIN